MEKRRQTVPATPIILWDVFAPIATTQINPRGIQLGIDADTAEQKAELIKGTSQLPLNVLNKPHDVTFVIIQ